MKYSQPDLPYAHDALAPAISKETVDFHYGKHEKAYIDNLNKLIEGTEFEEMPLEDVIRDAKGALFNNASQAWNHIFYFFSFSPDGGGEPEGDLRAAIDKQFWKNLASLILGTSIKLLAEAHNVDTLRTQCRSYRRRRIGSATLNL